MDGDAPPQPPSRATGGGGGRAQCLQQRQGPSYEGKQQYGDLEDGSVIEPALFAGWCSSHHHHNAAVQPKTTASSAATGASVAAASKGTAARAAAAGEETVRRLEFRNKAPVLPTAPVSEWVARAASVRCFILESALPVQISLDGAEVAALQPPPPLLLLLLRNSYLPHIFATCYEHFQLALRPPFSETSRCSPSFTYHGKLLDWRVPVGVLFDCFGAAAPAASRGPCILPGAAAAATQRRRRGDAAAVRQGAFSGTKLTYASLSDTSLLCDCSNTPQPSAGDAVAYDSSQASFVRGRCTRCCSSCSGSHTCNLANERIDSSRSPECEPQGIAEDNAVDKEEAGKVCKHGQMASSEGVADVYFSDIDSEEETEEGEEETEDTDVEEEEVVVSDAAEAAGCAVALPWQLTVHFRTPAAELAAANETRAAALAASLPEAIRKSCHSCCCSCAASRQQQSAVDLAIGQGAASATAATSRGPQASEAAAAATATTTHMTAGVSGKVITAAALDNRNVDSSEATRNTRGAGTAREENAAAAISAESGDGPPLGREYTSPKGQRNQVSQTVVNEAGCPGKEEQGISPTHLLASNNAVTEAPEGATTSNGVAAPFSSSFSAGASSSASITSSQTTGRRQPHEGKEPTVVLPPPVPPPSYEGWSCFESFFMNVVRQATFMLTGSAAAFHSLTRAEEVALLRAWRYLDVPAFLRATAPLLAPLSLPGTNVPHMNHQHRATDTHTRKKDGERESRQSSQQQSRCMAQCQSNRQSAWNSTTSTPPHEKIETTAESCGGYADARATSKGVANNSSGCEVSHGGSVGADSSASDDAARTLDSSAGGASCTAKGSTCGGSVAVAQTATHTSRSTERGGRATYTGRAAATTIAREHKARAAPQEKSTASQGGTAGATGRSGFERTLRRLPVRVHLVSSCCSAAALLAAGAPASSQDHQDFCNRSLIGGLFSSALGGTRTPREEPCGTRGLFFVRDSMEPEALTVDDCWCCVSSVLLACPPFMTAAAPSYRGTSCSVEPTGNNVTCTAAEPFRSTRPCYRGTVGGSISGRCPGDSGREGCYGRGDEYDLSSLTINAGFTSAARAPALSAFCVDAGSSMVAGQKFYTLGHMLHDLLPQLFPTQTWKLERKRVSNCSCSRLCCQCSSWCHCRYHIPGLTGNSGDCTARRRTLGELKQQCLLQRASAGCAAGGSSSGICIDVEQKEGAVARQPGQPQDAETSDSTCHGSCNTTTTDSQCTAEQVTAQGLHAPDADAARNKLAKCSDLRERKRREGRGDDAESEAGEEDSEYLVEPDYGREREGGALHIRSSFEQPSTGRSSHACRVLVQGVEPLFETPVYWLWLNAASLDFFLHVVVLLSPYSLDTGKHT